MAFGVEDKILADFLMSVGFIIGIITKGYGVWDKNCTWTRKSSLFNVITIPITALTPYFLLDTYYSLFFAFIKYIITIAKYVWRAPDEEDYLGRVDMTYSEVAKQKIQKFNRWI